MKTTHVDSLPFEVRLRLKCDGTCTETRFRLSAKRTSPFKSAGTSVLSTTGSQGVRISGSNAGYTMSWGSVKSTGYPLHSPVSPSLPLLCVTVCHHISTGLYKLGTCSAETSVCRKWSYWTFLPAENVAFQPLLLCNASVTNLINISPLEAVNVIRGDVPNVKPLFGCRRRPLVVAPS
jgi:hypothetical protein